MASEAGSYTPETIQRRQALADALRKSANSGKPMTHWMQGVAELGDTFAAGMLERKNRQEEKESREEMAKLLTQGQGAVSSSQPSPIPQGVMPIVPPQASTQGKVYSNDEPSPLDPPSGQDRDMAVRTVLAEADNQGAEGKLAVANVLRNRAVAGKFGGDTLPGVIQKPNQFEPWNTAGGRQKMAAIDPNSSRYQHAGGIVDQAYTGANDPTMGATHFYGPKEQAALGRNAPSWDNGKGVDIGDHRFFGGAGTPQVTAGASAPTEMSAQSRVPQAPPVSIPPSAQSQAPQKIAPPAGPREQIAEMLRSKNAYVRQTGAQLAQQMIQQQFGADAPTWGVIGEDEFGKKNYGWINSKKQTVTPANIPNNQSANNAPLTVPGPGGKPIPIPAGVNPKKFRDDVTSATADAATGKMTEVQAKSTSFANRMERAEADVGNIEGEGTSAFNKGAEAVPFGVGNYLKSPNAQKYQQARSQFITAMLRQESGAAINKDEFTRYDREFFPQPGDFPQAVEQKRLARKVAIDAMKKGAGPGYQSPDMATAQPQSNIDDLLKKYGG